MKLSWWIGDDRCWRGLGSISSWGLLDLSLHWMGLLRSGVVWAMTTSGMPTDRKNYAVERYHAKPKMRSHRAADSTLAACWCLSHLRRAQPCCVREAFDLHYLWAQPSQALSHSNSLQRGRLVFACPMRFPAQSITYLLCLCLKMSPSHAQPDATSLWQESGL